MGSFGAKLALLLQQDLSIPLQLQLEGDFLHIELCSDAVNKDCAKGDKNGKTYQATFD